MLGDADINEVEKKLKDMEDDIFEIRLVPGDIRSHKKYLYAIMEFPEDTIITVDDDVYYNSQMIEILVNTSIKYPNSPDDIFLTP